MLHYVIRYELDDIALRIVCVDSVNLCGPRSNINLTHYLRSTFEYYCANHACYHRIPQVIKLYTYVNTKLK